MGEIDRRQRDRIKVYGGVGIRVELSGGQEYRLIRFEDHRNRAGQILTLAVWETSCAECGEPMEVKALRGRVDFNRRCRAHRRPLTRVSRISGLRSKN